MTATTQSDDFDTAKGIFDQLRELPDDRKQRILRWISESLGVTAAPTMPAVPKGSSGTAVPESPSNQVPRKTNFNDIKSFTAAKAPKNDTQFAAVVAYFYRFEAPPAQTQDAIDGNTLQEAARLAGRRRLSNPRVTLNNAKAAGYLNGSSPGQFAINSVGENLVAMTLPGGTNNGTKVKSRARPKPKRKVVSRKR